MRILGLDFGSKTVGVAVCDPLGITAQGVEIIRRPKENHLRRTFKRIEELAGEYGAEAIVLGYPLNMDDSVGDRARQTLGFKRELEERIGLPVFLYDERLTTVAADEIMEEAGVSPEDYGKYVDKIAAQIILQDYLNNRPKK
ncbi:MAG TPA: Holliday junction resolvase RuvX [Lachnospiraceae bacterium]|nr:Holliday junction resolvase RuvX [Lachnospiraceae bacterium]